MDLIIPKETLDAAQLSADELRREIAVLLFERERLTLGQAAHFADMPQHVFMRLLAQRKIPLHYGAEELEEDTRTLRQLGLL